MQEYLSKMSILFVLFVATLVLNYFRKKDIDKKTGTGN